MSDRRRISGPVSGTAAPSYSPRHRKGTVEPNGHKRLRLPNSLRKMFLKTGVTPSASGSAYLEIPTPKISSGGTPSLASLSASSLKLICTVHGPRPLHKSAAFSPHINLATHVKYAPFAAQKRRGYLRDHRETDLGAHLGTALRGMIIGDRWPKSGVEVMITVLEGEDNRVQIHDATAELMTGEEWGLMTVLGACITVASAAIADAGIDCIDVVSGGVAAIARDIESRPDETLLILDPVPSEHQEIIAACVVAYSPARDEITNLWAKGDPRNDTSAATLQYIYEDLTNNAVQAAIGTHRVLVAALKEASFLGERQ